MSVFWPRLCCSLAFVMSRQEKLLRVEQAKIIQLQDELLTKQKEGQADAPKAAPVCIGDSAARL